MRYIVMAVLFVVCAACGDSEPRQLGTPGNSGNNDGSNDANAGNNANNANNANGQNGQTNVNAMNDAGSTNNATNQTPDMGVDMEVDLGPRPNPLEGIGEVVLVQEGFEFTEGPKWFPAENVLRFTDIPANTIYELTPPSRIAPWRNPSQGANGLGFDGQGRVLAAEHIGRRVSIATGPDTIVSEITEYQGQAFNSPNDLVLRRDGVVYFTDPPYGLNGRPREIAFNGLFRWVPGTQALSAEWEGDANGTRPNGVVLSPDERVLYLADTQADVVYAFDVGMDGALSNQREFADATSPDGMAVDRDGNVYAATADGIDVWAPDGMRWGTIEVERQPANCAFGGPQGRQLFVTARQGLYRVQMVVPGIY